jgi:diaminopimelate epimerase
MARPTMPLVKAQALGNDFLLLAAAALPRGVDLPHLARRACDRHYGVGADGLIVVRPTPDGASTRLLNADGSRSEVSGNGVRCVAAWLASDRALLEGSDVVVDTEAGPKTLTLLDVTNGRWTFRAAMGPPEAMRREQIDLDGTVVPCVVLRVGNPQCVVLGPLSGARLQDIAGRLAVHPFFPEGTNVELADVETADRVRILIWERGVGPTEASGTGACAAGVAAAAFGGASRSVDVVAPGGTQRVEWTDDGIFLTGWAEITASVDWYVDPA